MEEEEAEKGEPEAETQCNASTDEEFDDYELTGPRWKPKPGGEEGEEEERESLWLFPWNTFYSK